MLEDIRQLEKISRLLEPDDSQRGKLITSVLAYANDYLESIDNEGLHGLVKTYGDPPDSSSFATEAAITMDGANIDSLLTLLKDNVDSVGAGVTSGRYFGWIPGGGLFHAALGDYLAAVTNRYAGYKVVNSGAVQIENALLRWMSEVVGYPTSSSGNLTSGGSIANLIAIVCARDDRGITGPRIPTSIVYLTDQAHHSIAKALHVAGLGGYHKYATDGNEHEIEYHVIDVDERYRMKPESLSEAIIADKKEGKNPWLVVATAGTTNTGAVDPLKAISKVAAGHKLWFHIDGAYGAFFILCPEAKDVLEGIGSSDSIVMDPHKTLFLPYGTGAVLVRDHRKQYRAFRTEHAPYLAGNVNKKKEPSLKKLSPDDLSPGDLSPELTKHFRGLRLWLALKLLGVTPFQAALSEKIKLARYFYEQVKQIEGIEVGPYPDLSIVAYRYKPKRGDINKFNEKLEETVREEGAIFITSTKLASNAPASTKLHVWLRAAIVSFRTHIDDIDIALETIKRNIARLKES